MNSVTIRNPNDSEEARKAVCLEQLAQDRAELLEKFSFIGSIIMRMELIAVRDDRLMTASTDGDRIFVDIDFYSRLSKDERQFVLAHEVWHSVLLHFARRQQREAERFNIAADLEIHFTLKNESMTEPFVLPHDSDWEKLSAEEIYERLPDFLKKLPRHGYTSQRGKANEKFGDVQSSFDKHFNQGDRLPSPDSLESDGGIGNNGDTEGNDQGERGVEDKGNGRGKRGAEGKGNGRGKRGAKGKGNGGSDASTSSVPDADVLKNEIVIDKDYTPNISSEAVERSRSRTIAAAQLLERRQGKLPNHISELLDRLQKPSLPWQEMLKQFVTTCYGAKRRWLPPSRRHVWQDAYLPSMRTEALKAVVALDTSGSTDDDLPEFFGELVSLMKSFGKFDLDVIQCDAEIQNVEHYSETNIPPSDKKWNVKGFGGTDFRPVFDYIQKEMRERPDLLLFFTDGWGEAPDQCPSYPVMWVLTSYSRQPTPWGRQVSFKSKK